MKRREMMAASFHCLLLGLLAILLSPLWSKLPLRPIRRGGRRVRMFELRPGDVFDIWLDGDDAGKSTYAARSHPRIAWYHGGFGWSIDAKERASQDQPKPGPCPHCGSDLPTFGVPCLPEFCRLNQLLNQIQRTSPPSPEGCIGAKEPNYTIKTGYVWKAREGADQQ